jgi:predicted nucleic acid-binding protein
MAGLYVDTSALGRLLLAEPDAPAISEALRRYSEWWTSRLLIVELRRPAVREGEESAAEELLDGLKFVTVDATALERASTLPPPEVRALDAIHLEAAIRLRDAGNVTAMLTYDGQLQAGCAHHGLPIEAPKP